MKLCPKCKFSTLCIPFGFDRAAHMLASVKFGKTYVSVLRYELVMPLVPEACPSRMWEQREWRLS